MSFIPKDSLKAGDTVVLTEDVEVLSGTFTKGTLMTLVQYVGIRGWDLIDKDGNHLRECPSACFSKDLEGYSETNFFKF